MELAWATGYGPTILTDIEGRGPLVRAEDVVAIGYRDHKDQEAAGSQPIPAELAVFDLPAIRKADIETAVRAAVDHLRRPELDGFFIHLE